MFDQYQIAGTKITDDAKNFIATELFTQYEITKDKNGKPVTMTLYDMIGDALNKYSDARYKEGEAKSVDKQLVNLIIKKIQSQVFNDNSFNTKPLNEYAYSEHEIEVAGEGENLVLGIMEQFIASGRKGTIEPDWVAPDGRIFRRATFISSHNMEVHFCVEATEEVNKLIEDACTPEWMRKSTTKSEQ